VAGDEIFVRELNGIAVYRLRSPSRPAAESAGR
jgi:hypothetical protein